MRSKNRFALIGILGFLATGLPLLSMMAPAAMAQLQFSSQTNYPVGSSPLGVAVGDFNGDGKQDLAVINTGSGNVSILLGNGDGTFQPAVNYSVSSSPSFVAVGDFNGDGKLDLAVANGSANNISVLLGNGDGTFQTPVHYSAGASADYVAVADFNNDKKLDLLVSTGGTLSILLGNGDGTFQPAVPTSTGGSTPFVAVGDFNGDGKLDVATGNRTLLGNGDGTFQPPLTSSLSFVPDLLTAGDFNGDGKLDLAVEGSTRSCHTNPPPFGTTCLDTKAVWVLLGNGDGTFGAASQVGTVAALSSGFGGQHGSWTANGMAVADLNNDGKLDLVVMDQRLNYCGTLCGAFPAILTLLGNGDGTFQPGKGFSLTTLPNWLVVGDLNGDTLADVVVTSSPFQIPGTSFPGNSADILLNTTPSFTLSLTLAGTGGGTVTSKPAVMKCTNSCIGNFAPRTTVTLMANAAAGSTFAGWGGACSGTGACSITMSAAESVDTTFDLVTFPLTVSLAGTGKGAVTSSPAGINCGSSCSAPFNSGTIATLTATATTGSNFAGWSGACSGAGACNVTMNAAESVSATFNVPPDFSLSPASANLTGQRGGQVTDVITLAPQTGSFGNAIQLTCAVTGPSPMPTCALSPTSVTPGANSATSTLTVTVPGLSAGLKPYENGRISSSLYAVFLALPGLALCGAVLAPGEPKKRRRQLWLLCSFLIGFTALHAGCGGGSSSTPPPPPVNYTVTVTGSSGALQHNAQVTVTVP